MFLPTHTLHFVDIDNLVKFVLDSLNKVAFVDDRQVSLLSSAKLYTDGPPKIVVHIRKLFDSDAMFGEHFPAEDPAP
jgi:hypothetical protein